jgi:serine protease Do
LAAAVHFWRVAFWHLRAKDKQPSADDPTLFIKTDELEKRRRSDSHTTMKVPRIFTLTCAALLSGSPLLAARQPCHDLKDLTRLEARIEAVSQRVMPATVALISKKSGSSGSGVITTADGLILTAAHVVQGAEEVEVVFSDGKQVTGKVLGANFSKDIAMVQITTPGPWPCAEMGTSKSLTAGDWVLALGHSAGFDAARTPPVRFGRVISRGPGYFLTTDCTLIGGDSGGPLFDLEGKIIGINSSIGVSLTNNNHAGIDGFKQDWDRIKGGEAWGKLSIDPFRNPETPALGIQFASFRGVKGVTVTRLVMGSPAAAAGVRRGDVIQTLNGGEISEESELLQIIAKQRPADTLKLGILRDSTPLELDVKLSSRGALFSE